MRNKILFDFYAIITLEIAENLCPLNCTDSQTLLDFVHVLFLFLQQQNCQTCMKCGMGQQPEYCCTVRIPLHELVLLDLSGTIHFKEPIMRMTLNDVDPNIAHQGCCQLPRYNGVIAVKAVFAI